MIESLGIELAVNAVADVVDPYWEQFLAITLFSPDGISAASLGMFQNVTSDDFLKFWPQWLVIIFSICQLWKPVVKHGEKYDDLFTKTTCKIDFLILITVTAALMFGGFYASWGIIQIGFGITSAALSIIYGVGAIKMKHGRRSKDQYNCIRDITFHAAFHFLLLCTGWYHEFNTVFNIVE
jgi:hypothetical protein